MKKRRWKDCEIGILIAHPSESIEGLCKLLPNRTYCSIVTKRGNLGLIPESRRIISCSNCNRLFSRRESHIRKENFCSQWCHNASRVVLATVTCAQCGIDVTRTPHRLSERSFCSRECQGMFFSGAMNPAWKGGITSSDYRQRRSKDYEDWRASVFTRDEYTCEKCRQVGGGLVAHHVLGFAKHPHLRLSIDNGVTLCKGCHQEFHNTYGYKDFSDTSYFEWHKEAYDRGES